MKFLFFVNLFLIAPPFFEIINLAISGPSIFYEDIFYYFAYIILASSIGVVAASAIQTSYKNKTIFIKEFSFGNFELISIALIGLFSFQLFFGEVIGGYSVFDFVVFSEEYRNGVYKGSGVYTVALIHVLPMMLAINIAFGRTFDRVFYACLFLICLTTLILGLRIYLLKVVLAFVYKISISKFNYRKIFVFSVVLLLFLALYKFLLSSNDGDEKNIILYILNPLTRLNFVTLVNFRFGHAMENAYCLFPTMEHINQCLGEEFKFQHLATHAKLATGFPNLSKYSGVAIPLPVYIYNIFGFLGIFITIIFTLIIFKMFEFTRSPKIGMKTRLVVFVVLLNLISAMIEDVLFLQFSDISIAILLILIAVRWVVRNVYRFSWA